MSNKKADKAFQKKVSVLQAANQIPSSKIYIDEDKSQYFEVYGLTTNNLAYLTANWPTLANFFLEGLVMRGENVEDIYADFIKKSPHLATQLISCCTRDDEGNDNTESAGDIGNLSLIIIIDAVTEIIKLSKPKTEEQEKKFLATLNWLKRKLSETSSVASTVIEGTDK